MEFPLQTSHYIFPLKLNILGAVTSEYISRRNQAKSGSGLPHPRNNSLLPLSGRTRNLLGFDSSDE